MPGPAASPPPIATSIEIEWVQSREDWDAAIRALGGGILQSWDWGVFKDRHGWRAVRLLGKSNGQPVAGSQLLLRNLGPLSVAYAPRGPVLSGEADESTLPAMTLAIDNLAREQRSAIAFIEPELPLPDSSIGNAGLGWSPAASELQPLRTIKVQIDRSDDEILAGMKPKTRYNVRLAGRRGVTVREAGLNEVARFYELLEETGERDAFGIHSVEYYADMLDVFGDGAVLLFAEVEKDLAAGAIVLQHQHEAIYMFGASTRKHQRDMPSHLLQFEAMRWARTRGCTIYDLWGIPESDTPPADADSQSLNVRAGLWGVYRFKQGFGGEIVSYPGVYERQYYPRLVSLWRRIRPGIGL